MSGHSDWLPALLPSTVIIAILLFVTREGLEWNRRRLATSRQVKAFKTLFARECEVNRWALERLRRSLRCLDGKPQAELAGEIEIQRKISGDILFVCKTGSWPLPEVRLAFMRDNMFAVAALDENLFKSLEDAYDAIIDLEHVRGSLIQNLEDRSEHLEGFVGWALGEVADVKLELERLYLACTGFPLEENWRVR